MATLGLCCCMGSLQLQGAGLISCCGGFLCGGVHRLSLQLQGAGLISGCGGSLAVVCRQ